MLDFHMFIGSTRAGESESGVGSRESGVGSRESAVFGRSRSWSQSRICLWLESGVGVEVGILIGQESQSESEF